MFTIESIFSRPEPMKIGSSLFISPKTVCCSLRIVRIMLSSSETSFAKTSWVVSLLILKRLSRSSDLPGLSLDSSDRAAVLNSSNS